MIRAAALAVLLLAAGPAGGFTVPERLEYDIRWLGIKAGTAFLSIELMDGRYVITSRALSTDFIAAFYPVDDSVRVVVESVKGAYGHPLHYAIKVNEGTNHKDREVHFRRKEKRVIAINNLEKTCDEIDTAENLYDPLSGFFSVRQADIGGKPVRVKVFDNKKIWDVEVEVLRKEKVEVPAGTFNTILVKPKLQSEGIFFRKGDIFIWLTDDHRKVPVMLRTRSGIGSITAELVKGEF